MQRNRAYSQRVKQLKIKAKRQRAKTTDNRISNGAKSPTRPKIFNSVEIIKCAATKTKCKAFQRIVYCLKLYNKFMLQYTTSYHEQILLSANASPSVSPFDIITESNLKPSNRIRNNKKKNNTSPKSPKSPKSPYSKSQSFYSLYRSKCGELYNNIHLLNDLNHLTQKHDLYELHAHITAQFNLKHISCDIGSCISLNRTYRDRTKCCTNNRFRQTVYLGHYDPNEVITQQMMDRIHNYLLHTFDIGMRLNPVEIEGIEMKANNNDESFNDDTLRKMNEIIISKRDIVQQLTGHKYLTKFTSIVDEGQYEGHYSPRYYYWSVYRDWDCADRYNPGYTYQYWYCKPTLPSLKHELLSLSLLSNAQWSDMMALSAIYKQCDAIKMIKADFDDLHGYGIKRYTPIETQHLLSVLIYCNFECIRKRFSQTFVRIPTQETDHHLIERHSRFANFGRLLRESVEVFGERTLFSKVNRFYHCFDKEFMFKQRCGYFNAPTSTCIHYETVINLNKKCGVVLQFADKNDTHINGGLRFFNTSLLSDYIYEYEMLFVSSLSPLHIETVIQCNLAHNYASLINSLDVLYQMMKGQRYKNVMNDAKDEIYKRCAHKLIEHQLGYAQHANIPKYIEHLLDYFFLNTTQITIEYDYLTLFKTLFIEEQSYIKLDVLLQLFPHIAHITISSIKSRLLFDDDAFTAILEMLSSRSASYIEEIVLKEALPQTFCPSISKFENMFIESRWFITQQNSNLIFKRSTYDVV